MENKEITDLAKEFFEMADFNKDNFVCKEDYIQLDKRIYPEHTK